MLLSITAVKMPSVSLPSLGKKCHLGNALVSRYYFRLHKKKIAKEQRVAEDEPVCIT